MTLAMPQLKNAVKKFLAALGPKDQVTVAAFNDNMFTLTKRETSVAQRTRAIDRLSAWGGTALYDVIIRGVQQLSRQPGRRVLVVFSDGDDRTSHATIHAVEQAVRANDATLFMVALGRGVKEAQLKSGIERLVELSGGRALFVERSDQLDEPFAEILEELSNQYIIGYESNNPKRNGALARSEGRDPRRRLQRARAPGLSRAGFVIMRSRRVRHCGNRCCVLDRARRRSSHQPPQVRGRLRNQGGDRARRRQRRRSRREAGRHADAGRFRARGQRPAAPDHIDPVHLDGADQHHAGHTARVGLHLEREPRPRAACCCSWSTKAACASAPTAPCCARRRPCSSDWRRATWSVWRGCRPASAASSSPPIASASPTP